MDDYADDDFLEEEEGEENEPPETTAAAAEIEEGMKADDAVAAQIEFAQNEREMAHRKHLRSLRPQKVREKVPSLPRGRNVLSPNQ